MLSIMESKYSNILTMILVVLIVAILGVVGYFTYGMFQTKSIDKNAQSALDEFDKATKTISKSDSNENKVEEDVAQEEYNNPLDLLNTTNTEEATKKDVTKTYMEDYEVMGKIKIPKTGIEYPVLNPLTKRSLEIAVAIAYGPGLSEVGNTVIYGHNYRRTGVFFSDNKKLSNGDKIYITDQTGTTITYVIYNIYETSPNDASYMQRDTEGRREISLQTCTDDSSARIIVWAKEEV